MSTENEEPTPMTYEEFKASGGYGPCPVRGFEELVWVKRNRKIYLQKSTR